MAKIPNTQLSWVDVSGAVETLLANGDTLEFRGDGHVLILRNPTASPISPVLTGSAATYIDLPGVGRVDLTGGLQVGAIAAGASVVLPICAHYHWLAGTVTMGNCAGLLAVSLEDGLHAGGIALRRDPMLLLWQSAVMVLDPSSRSSLWQDAAGTVAVTAPGQPVGVVADQSGADRSALQLVAAARPTYRIDAGGRPYLEFDGVDDCLATLSVPLGASGRTIIAAIRKRSDAASGVVVDTGASWLSAAGGAALFAPSYPGSATFGSRAMPAAEQSIRHSGATYPAPSTAVVTATSTGGSHVLRVNGQVAASGAPAGPMAALTAAVNIGARNGNQLYAAMDLYALLVIDRVLNAQELALAERWAGQKCGVTI